MTKLEEKLINLGYYKHTDFIYIKYIRNLEYLKVDLVIDTSTISGRIHTDTNYYFEKEASDFVKAFNQLQQDLEVLKENEI